jgi:hypothetical protein
LSRLGFEVGCQIGYSRMRRITVGRGARGCAFCDLADNLIRIQELR